MLFDTKDFKELLQARFEKLLAINPKLFVVDLDTDAAWNMYLDSFPPGTNEVFRERRTYDCSTCRQFITRAAAIVAIKDGVVYTLFDVTTGEEKFQAVADAMNAFVLSHAIEGIFLANEPQAGNPENIELLENGETITWSHLHIAFPQAFTKDAYRHATVRGEARMQKEVFKRGLDEISFDALEMVIELSKSRTLYKGEEWVAQLEQFHAVKTVYTAIPEDQKDLYAWEKSVSNGAALNKLRNTSIGTLLVDLSNGRPLEASVQAYEKIVAPQNYKRTKAIFTQKQIEAAQAKVIELGFENSLARRYAKIDDITPENTIWSNKDAQEAMQTGIAAFSALSAKQTVSPEKLSGTQKISFDDFVANVIPSAKELEVLVENKHKGNFMSLIAPQDVSAPSMLKWSNNFGWAYTGNVTDSLLKENVKNAGGKVEGALRFSLQWNDIDRDPNDLDAYCDTPRGGTIFFGRKNVGGGELDVDIQNPIGGKAAVENIIFTNIHSMSEGKYKFFVNNYANRGGRSGFRAEIEFDGQIHSFDYNKEIPHKGNVFVAIVTLKNGQFTIETLIDSSSSSAEVFGVNTNQFVPVSILMASPNYWDGQTGIGNRHAFFMLKDAKNPESPNGFYNEFLKEELREHRQVFEALGAQMAVTDTDEQLSGLGFSSTQRAEVIVKVKGATERLFAVQF